MLHKLYEYVDETGRDPFAAFFIIGIVLIDYRRQELSRRLIEIERESGKGIRKWKKSGKKRRQLYMELISKEQLLVASLYYVKYDQKGDYFVYTADAISRTLKEKSKEDQITIFIDGFRKKELNYIKKQLRPSVRAKVIVKTIMREESDAIMRLADALCGLVRDSYEGDEWSKGIVSKLKRKGLLIRR